MILGANFGPYSDSEFSDFFRKEFQRYDLVSLYYTGTLSFSGSDCRLLSV